MTKFNAGDKVWFLSPYRFDAVERGVIVRSGIHEVQIDGFGWIRIEAIFAGERAARKYVIERLEERLKMARRDLADFDVLQTQAAPEAQ